MDLSLSYLKSCHRVFAGTLLLLGCFLLNNCGVPDIATTQASIPTAHISPSTSAIPTYDWDAYALGLNTSPTPTLKSADATSEAWRQLNETAVARNRATARAASPKPIPTERNNQRMYRTPVPTTKPIKGISPCDIGDHIHKMYITSCWEDEIGDRRVHIYAGASTGYDDGDQHAPSKFLICSKLIASKNPNDTLCSHVFWLDNDEGALRILTVNWPHITFVSLMGNQYHFNGETLTWEPLQATPTPPTATPMGTFTQ